MAVKVLELHHHGIRVGATAQIHLMGVNGQAKFAQGPDKDAATPHVALAVPDIVEARAELDRLGVDYFITESVVGPHLTQVSFRDPAGNLIELHEIGTCRCNSARRPAAGTMA